MSQRKAVEKDVCEASLDSCTSTGFPRSLAVVIVLGFGLFYGVSTSSYLSAFASIDESFLFVPDIFFNVVVAASVVATAGTIVFLTVRGKLSTFSLPFWMPIGLLIFANIAVFFNLFALLPFGLPLLIPGIIYGIASVILRLVWLELFAMQKPSSMILQIVLGFVVGAVISVMLQNAHASVQSVLNCVLLVAIGLCARYARQKAPVVFAEEKAAVLPKPSLDRYKSALLAIGDAIVAFWVLEAVVGLLNSFMLAGQISFAGSGSVATVARFGALVLFCLFAFAVRRFPNISTFSRVVMPILAAMLVFLPFLSEGYSLFFNIMLLSSYYFIAMLITYLAVDTARTHRISVYVPMGFAMMGTRLCLAVALI
ncbi:MAG: LuxR family transcriptional regulator, partial [Raoultibacter sp.]